MEAIDSLFCFSLFVLYLRMDDIQLCKDIMSLKQELRQIVSVPGTLAYILLRTTTKEIAFYMNRTEKNISRPSPNFTKEKHFGFEVQAAPKQRGKSHTAL